MEYTQNYQLPLWDKEDAVIRTDFNENNQKIDNAIKAIEESRPFVIGSYTGTGSTSKNAVVELGFQPIAVLIAYPEDDSGAYGTFIDRDHPLTYSGTVTAQITATGFEVALATLNSNNVKPYTNIAVTCLYIAFR